MPEPIFWFRHMCPAERPFGINSLARRRRIRDNP
jgi:hypothetical protein